MNSRRQRAQLRKQNSRETVYASPADFAARACVDSRFEAVTAERAMTNARNRAVVVVAYAQPEGEWRQWRRRTVSLAVALRRLEAGEVVEQTRKSADGTLVTFFKETSPMKDSVASPCALTMATMLAVARRSDNRTEAPLTAAERKQIANFLMWPMEHDRRNGATIVPGSKDDLRRAEAELARAQRAPRRDTGGRKGGGVRAEHYTEGVTA